jgi:hypothetical protein
MTNVSIPLALPEVQVRQDFERRRERVLLGIETATSQRFADAWQNLMHATWAPDAPGVVMPPEWVDLRAGPEDKLVPSSFILEESLVTDAVNEHSIRTASPPECNPSVVVSGYSPTNQRRVLHIANVVYCQLRCPNSERDYCLLILECRQHPPNLRLFDGRPSYAS